MTDKELLELAAKAAGIKGIYHHWDDTRGNVSCGIAPKIACGAEWWNPLTDKAYCLQMEIDLKLFAVPSHFGWSVGRVFYGDFHYLAHHADRQRASTMAAAEISKNLSA